ncbi:mannonate dehydratase [Pontibacillus halophilus JSM 076056 = DSM 19796]|uniref:Mannonate dehydratase n=1 Tax=Pontibacillus halophilus JSM 076056 = DSM 19796 TaxID=1385510 RepID=A0A0A5G9Y4_9BACI|nr:mannonate dehydratase [Pontibacillus halophilus]KGX89971.1 mannonate dehydratase [Pontibacillus halophilus JSM 076056 = DSM 19796]
MEMSFRWYGESDPVTLQQIKQIPQMKGIVSAIYEIPPGDVWPYDKIVQLKDTIEQEGLQLNVIESVPVHEDIKLGRDSRDTYIENYVTTLRHLAKAGVVTVCYNFMPVFDWTRTNLTAELPDESNSLSYEEEVASRLNPLDGELTLPGWDLSYQMGELEGILAAYQSVSEEQLMENLFYFLERVIPVAEEVGINMAIHPDDPPWSILGLPRVVTNVENVVKLLNRVDSPRNGLTFCTGSFGSLPSNDLVDMIEAAKGRIHFVHARNVKWIGEASFQETSHSVHDGSLPMVAVMKKLVEVGFVGPIRPDHGRMIWGEEGRPGYGLYDRALGATYLNGILDCIQHN